MTVSADFYQVGERTKSEDSGFLLNVRGVAQRSQIRQSCGFSDRTRTTGRCDSDLQLCAAGARRM